MLRIKQIGTICFAIFAFISPLFATGVSSTASTADCDNATLNTYTGTSNLQANWDANTIGLHWYADENATTGLSVQNASQSCVYDGTLTPPPVASVPQKTGYTFKGWKVRQFCEELPSTLISTSPTAVDCKAGEGWYVCDGLPGAGTLGLTASNTWAISWANGDVLYGSVRCSARVGDEHEGAYGTPSSDWLASESELISAGNGGYCWCGATGYKPNGGTRCSIASPLWVVDTGVGVGESACGEFCARSCAKLMLNGIADNSSGRGAAIQTMLLPVLEELTCDIPSAVASVAPASTGYKNENGSASSNASSTFGLTENGTWAGQWTKPTKSKVYGRAICSYKAGNNNSNRWNNPSSYWSATESELTSASGSGLKRYCWCLATGFQTLVENQYGDKCNTGNSVWIFKGQMTASSGSGSCTGGCASSCASGLSNYSTFRSALLASE